MTASEYTILATSERHREFAAFWRGQFSDPEGFGTRRPQGAAADPSVTRSGGSRRRSMVVALGTGGQACIDALATDDLGRFTVVAAGLSLALARYLNRGKILLRTPLLTGGDAAVLNETHEVPLVFVVDDETSLRDFLQQSAAIVEESYALQDYPVGACAQLDCGVDLDAIVEFSVSSARVHGPSATRHAAIHFRWDDGHPDRIEMSIDPDELEPWLADGLAEVVSATFERFADLSTRIDDIDRLPSGQQHQLLADWNDTAVTWDPFVPAHRLFEERARQSPDAVALRYESETVTFGELDARANRLAHHLMAAGGQARSSAIGIWMNRSPWLAVAVLGVLKAGRAYLPIDTACPPDRLRFMVGDAGVTHLLVDEAHAEQIAELSCASILVDRELQASPAAPDVAVGSSDLAYVIYTSGSTGVPKGCAIEHSSMMNYLRWAMGYYWTSPDAGAMALFTPLSFDLTIPSFFCPLLRGRTLHIFPQDLAIDEVLRRQFSPGSGIDSIKLTPAHIRVLQALPIERSDVGLAIVGGEALTADMVGALHALNPAMRVVNEYGPTEATVGCIAKEISAGEAVVIGRPIANTQAYVLDRRQRLVPAGVRGELWIGGAGVARGYVGRPALDAERFLPNPFVPGGRVYRTGDIARWLPSGELECFGRSDAQVKIHGYRIEPAEIETALRAQPGIREALVVAHTAGEQAELVAYVVADTPMDPVSLRRSLKHTLPLYMVPATFVELDAFPLTANGKVDRARLPAPSRTVTRHPHVEPRTPHEQALADIWRQVFRLDSIGVDQNFFELGGQSLRAMAIAQRIYQTLGLDVSIGEILSHPSIASLAGVLASRQRQPTGAADTIAPVPAAEHYAVSHGQRRLWLIDRIDDGSAAYNISSAFDLQGPLDRAALARACEALAARHESLRTTFTEVNDEPRQRIGPAAGLPVTFTDLREAADRDAQASALVAANASAPFNLATGPLVRVDLIHMADARWILAMTLHHIVTDGWSMRVLISDLLRLYEAERSHTPGPPALPIQYKDFAEWQRQQLASPGMAADLAYWRAKLAGGAVLDLPADRPRPPAPTAGGRHHQFLVDADRFARLRQLGAAHGASPFMVMVALVKTLLYRYTGEPDIRVGSPIAGRLREDLAEQVGFYVNTLVLADTLDGHEPFSGLLDRVKQTAEEAYTHQAAPFDRLTDELDVTRDLGRSPLFDVMVAYDVDADAMPPAAGITVSDLRLETGLSKFDLTWAFAESHGALAVELEYRTDLFDADRIEKMSSHFARVIDDVLADAGTQVDRLGHDAIGPTPPAPPRVAAQASSQADRSGPVAPRNERELLLVGLLESVLGRKNLSVTDNYFHVGGDSITAIQVVNRLAREGWALRVRDLFEAPRIETLAQRLTPIVAPARRVPAEGQVPLTPIQRWFFLTQPDDRAHFNQSVMLRFDQRIDEDALRAIGTALITEHAALRLRYRIDDGVVHQFYGAPYDPVAVHDLRNGADALDASAALERLAAAAQGSLNLEDGPLARLVLFRLPDGDRLLAIVHHLAVDGVSWRILLDDVRTGLEQTSRGEAVHLATPSDSYKAWALALEASAGDMDGEAAWWREVLETPVRRLPVDVPTATADSQHADATDAGAGREADAIEQRFTLSVDDTAALVSRVHQAYNTRVPDVLLAGLARAMRAWAGPGAVLVDIETHGRQLPGTHDRDAAVDVSRTVGWFTALYPVVLDLGDDEDPGRQLKGVKESLRRTPGDGLGYGLLFGGRPSGASILFNFLGQFDTDLSGLHIADEARGPEHGPSSRLTHDLTIGGWISDDQLHVTVRHSPRRFGADAIVRLCDEYRDALATLIAHCRTRVTRERTASDFRVADAATPALMDRLGADRVEDVYPLTPMQEGLLYHAVLAGDAVDAAMYVEQFTCVIDGEFDASVFQRAWEDVQTRHAALRTAVIWRDVPRPVQVVFAAADAPWTVLDWRGLSAERREARLETFAEQDRARGLHSDLDAERPPLRFALIRTGDTAYRFFWTWHHVLLDGWSTAIVLQEVFARYTAAVTGATFAPSSAGQFGDYVDWLSRQNSAGTTAYWRERLRGFTAPTPLPSAPPAAAPPARTATVELTWPADASERIANALKEQHLTLNSLAQGAWALLLARHANSTDVVFGATVAGRPAALPGVASIVGLFINTLPVRVHVDPHATLAAWLHRVQLNYADLDQHAIASLAEIQQVSEVPRRAPLFETLLVVENYPVDQSIVPERGGLRIDGIAVAEATNYPLTVMVVPGESLMLRLSYDTTRCDDASARELLRDMQSRIDAFVTNPNQTVEAVIGLSDPASVARVRHRFTLDAAISLDRARRLVTMVCGRYSAHEDLRYAIDDSRAAEGSAPNDLAFRLADAAGRVNVEAWSDTGRFDEAFLQRIQGHLSSLHAHLDDAPLTHVDRLPLMDAAEQAHLVDEFNRTDRDWGPARTIAQYFEAQAAADPDRIAVRLPAVGRDDIAEDETWTYGELNTRANQLARVLRTYGVGPDVRVGVLMERSCELVLALMAVEKAGGAYVPLDPDYPRDLLQFMMNDAAVAVVLTAEPFRDTHLQAGVPVLCLDTDWERIARERGDNLASAVEGTHLAYVIYTSGSTGQPKGAMNTHRGIANRLLWMQDVFGLTAHDRVLQKTPFSFDVSVWEFFWPLMFGAQLIVAKPGGHRDAAYLVELIAETGVTTLHFVPSMLQAFIDEPGLGRCRSLARVICSGEAVTPELLRRYHARVPVPLDNLYGPTEAAVDVTHWRCTTADERSMVPIGRPIANLRLYIVDAHLQPVPEGVIGELVLGGVGVGRGYLNRPDLTPVKFVPDVFRPSGGTPLYRTGDLARYRADGVVDFFGRIDHQIKLRGFRIELGEIESALLTLPGVRECVVVVRDDSAAGAFLAAYIVAATGADPSPDAVRAHLRQRLPAHMVPNVFVTLDALPRLTNGKLDRKSLPAPQSVTVSPIARAHVRPRGPVERRLARVWEAVLGQDGIGVTDDFFDLGGHSILALKLVSAIQAAFGRSVPLARLLAHPTIERLALALTRDHDPEDWRPLVAITRGGQGRPLFLLPGAGGNVLYFQALAHAMKSARPIYGLQAVGLDGRTPPLTQIEAMAAVNIDAIRREFPQGPYSLAGHSFGGQVALEMARQLSEQGHAVDLLAILDTAAPAFERDDIGAHLSDAGWLAKIAQEIEEFFGVALGVTFSDLDPLPLDRQLALIVERMQRAGVWAPGAGTEQLHGYLEVYKANSQAVQVRYDGATPRVPIVLFKAMDRDADIDAVPVSLQALHAERAWGWDRFATGDVRVIDVPGAHLSMLGAPHVIALARALDDVIG